MEMKRLFLIIFDISGYTRFMRTHDNRIMQAEAIVAELLSTIITTAKAPLRLHEISGDAVSFHVESGNTSSVAKEIWEQVNSIFEAFRLAESRLLGEEKRTSGTSDGERLKLKAVLHHGEAVFSHLHGFTKIAGPEVILAHRLLKNSVAGDEYVILTTGFYSVADDVAPKRGVWQGEDCEGFGFVCILVCYPEGRVPEDMMVLFSQPQSDSSSEERDAPLVNT